MSIVVSDYIYVTLSREQYDRVLRLWHRGWSFEQRATDFFKYLWDVTGTP